MQKPGTVVRSTTLMKTYDNNLESKYYVTQKVRHALELLMGENSEENLQRLKIAAVRAMQGALPAHRHGMGEQTRTNLSRLQSAEFHDFYTLRDAFIGYVMASQRDVGQLVGDA
jgi:hypothetical protein